MAPHDGWRPWRRTRALPGSPRRRRVGSRRFSYRPLGWCWVWRSSVVRYARGAQTDARPAGNPPTGCHCAVPAAGRGARYAARMTSRRALTLTAMSLGYAVVQLDVTIVNTALDSIDRSLG